MSAAGVHPAHTDGRGRRSNLQLRLLTAVVGLPLVVAVVYLGGWPLAIAAGLVALLASAEFTHGWLLPSMPIRAVAPHVLSFGGPAVMVVGTHGDHRYIGAGLILAGLFAVAGYAPTKVFGPRRPYRVQAWCLVYIGLLLSSLVLLRDSDSGREWLTLAIASTFAVDTSAYAVGRLVGRHKMAPRISPKKTWEGAAGGFAGGVGAVLLLNALLDTGESSLTMLPFAFICPVAAQAGDLLESWMKRRMGVKDASGLLPGHGGFLDRLDSILFVVPLLYVFLRLRVL
ncbi:MAG: phosphatidate cytidylyltransferase [Dehalococcoidia bacterium]